MKLRFPFVLVLAASLLASAAFAQSGIILRVGDCAAGSNVQSVVNDCSLNTGNALDLVVSCVVPMPFPDFVGAIGYLNVLPSDATVPDWWRLDGSGCRASAFTSVGDATVSPSCSTVWDPFSGMLSAHAAQLLYGYNNVLRMSFATAMPAAGTLEGDGVTEYGVFRIQVSRARSNGATACAGCGVHAQLVLAEVQFQNTTGMGTMHITVPAHEDPANLVVTYDGQYPTPTANRTWGAIKALYR